MPRTEQLGTTISLVMLGLILSVAVVLPARVAEFTVLGSQLAVHLSGRMQIAVALGALVAAGTEAVLRDHPKIRGCSLAYSATYWALPSVLVLASLVIVQQLPWWGYRLAYVLAAGAILGLATMLQYHTVDPDDPHAREAHLGLNFLVYAVALFVFVYLYGARLRSVISATGVMAASGALALELLRTDHEELPRTWLYAAVTGLLLGELTWVLNSSALDAAVGGGVLLIAFYVLTGLSQQHLWGQLNRRVVAEYVGLAGVGLLLIVGVFGWS